jgi:hypothetical protein
MGTYDKYLTADPKTEPSPASAAAPQAPTGTYDKYLTAQPDLSIEPAAVPQPIYRGAVLPFTRYSDDSVRFDPFGSGLVGNVVTGYRNAADMFHRAASGENIDPGDPATMGAVLNAAAIAGPVNPYIRSGDRAIPGVVGNRVDMRRAVTPTAEELSRVGGRQIEDVRNLPVRYNPESIRDLGTIMEQDLVDKGVFPEDASALYQTVRRMQAPVPEGAMFTPSNLISLRKNIANKFGVPTENQAGVGVAHQRLNEFIENPPQSAILAGPAAAEELGRQYAIGRANSAAGFRGAELNDIREAANLSRSAANSGQNFDNAIRQRVKSMALDEERTRGFTDPEVSQLKDIVYGAPGTNAMRAGGNILGGGGGLGANIAGMAAGGISHLFGFGPGATMAAASTAPVIGGLLKRSAAQRTAGALDELNQATRQRSPLFQEQLAGQDLVPDSTPGRAAVAQALMQMQLRQPPMAAIPEVSPGTSGPYYWGA